MPAIHGNLTMVAIVEFFKGQKLLKHFQNVGEIKYLVNYIQLQQIIILDSEAQQANVVEKLLDFKNMYICLTHI